MLSEKVRVGVLRGGPSNEYDISLKTGGTMLAHLPEKYHGVDIYIDKEGNWHLYGRRVDPHGIFGHVDVVLNGLHGIYGEDGQVQEILHSHRIPFSGPGKLGAAFSMAKSVAKNILSKFGIKTPAFRVIDKDVLPFAKETASYLYRTFPQPSVIKPVYGGSAVGVIIVDSRDSVENALVESLGNYDEVIIEEFIQGKEATCAVIEEFRGESHYSLLPVEIGLPSESRFYDYFAKYGGQSVLRVPASLTREESSVVQKSAITAHKELGLRHYSSSDFIVHPKRGVYYLETNALPGLTPTSPLPKALEAIGCPLPAFLDHIVCLSGK